MGPVALRVAFREFPRATPGRVGESTGWIYTKVMGRFPGEDSCLTLGWAVLDLLMTHETNGIRFPALDHQHLNRSRYTRPRTNSPRSPPRPKVHPYREPQPPRIYSAKETRPSS